MSIFSTELILSAACCASVGRSPRNYEQSDEAKKRTTRHEHLRKYSDKSQVAIPKGTMNDIYSSNRNACRPQFDQQVWKRSCRDICESYKANDEVGENRDTPTKNVRDHETIGDIDWHERRFNDSKLYHPSSIQYTSTDQSEEETDTTSTSINSMYDVRGEYEWGWFEDFDDYEDRDHARYHLNTRLSLHSVDSLNKGSLRFSCSRDNATSITSPSVVRRQVSSTFQLCRTFPPLRLQYDAAYANSEYEWLQSLSSSSHIPVKLQIRTFRIVKSKQSILGCVHHAEFLIELAFDEQYKSRWCRCSSLARFVRRLPQSGHPKTRKAWKYLNESNRWVDRLELSYLHTRCKLLERFAYMLLLECTTVHTLADLLES
ncbi:hypothetical protein ABG067_001499 [Albugo candida]